MTTASTNTTIGQTTNANFQAWVNEVYTNLVTNCGLTQSADTGQMAVPCVTSLPGAANTLVGYYVFQFNDTLQATSPVFIRMDFGSGPGGSNCPQLNLTIGSSTNGAGTIGGTHTAQFCAFASNNAPSTVTNYISRFCYNATQGFLGMCFKLGGAQGTGGANTGIGGFLIYRSVDTNGAPTATSLNILSNSNSTTTQGSGVGFIQVLNYPLASVSSGGNANAWATVPLSITTTLQGTSAQVFPIFQKADTSTTAGTGITNACALAVLAEATLNATLTCTILGSTSHTYMSIGCPFGSNVGGSGIMTNVSYAVTTYGLVMLWE